MLRDFLDWLISGISVLIVVGSLIGIVIWQHHRKEDTGVNEPRIINPQPSDSFNPATNK